MCMSCGCRRDLAVGAVCGGVGYATGVVCRALQRDATRLHCHQLCVRTCTIRKPLPAYAGLILVLPATDASGNAISSIVFHSDIRSPGSSDGSGSLAEEEEGPSHAAVIRLTYYYEAFIVLSILLVAGMSPARYGKATTL